MYKSPAIVAMKDFLAGNFDFPSGNMEYTRIYIETPAKLKVPVNNKNKYVLMERCKLKENTSKGYTHMIRCTFSMFGKLPYGSQVVENTSKVLSNDDGQVISTYIRVPS